MNKFHLKPATGRHGVPALPSNSRQLEDASTHRSNNRCISGQLGAFGCKHIHFQVNRWQNEGVEHALLEQLTFFDCKHCSQTQTHTGRPCVTTKKRWLMHVNAGTVRAIRNAGGRPVAGLNNHQLFCTSLYHTMLHYPILDYTRESSKVSHRHPPVVHWSPATASPPTSPSPAAQPTPGVSGTISRSSVAPPRVP